MRAPAVGTRRLLDPAGFDKFEPRVTEHTGHRVELTQPYATPKNGTMGHAYVNCLECKEKSGYQPFFVGLVLLSSLVKVGK